jgi:hypothetical protein
VHTDEKENKPAGKQVAWNKIRATRMELYWDESGEVHPISTHSETFALIRSEYIPIGYALVHPTKWSRKEAGRVLLEYYIKDKERIIEDSTKELEALRRSLSRLEAE